MLTAAVTLDHCKATLSSVSHLTFKELRKHMKCVHNIICWVTHITLYVPLLQSVPYLTNEETETQGDWETQSRPHTFGSQSWSKCTVLQSGSSSFSTKGLSDEPFPLDLSSFHLWLWRPASPFAVRWPSTPSSSAFLLFLLFPED